MTLHTAFVQDKVYRTREASRWKQLGCTQMRCIIGLCHQYNFHINFIFYVSEFILNNIWRKNIAHFSQGIQVVEALWSFSKTIAVMNTENFFPPPVRQACSKWITEFLHANKLPVGMPPFPTYWVCCKVYHIPLQYQPEAAGFHEACQL